MKKSLPWIILSLLSLWVVASMRIPADKTWAVEEFGKLPVVSNGRFQPIDSLARNSLLQLREKQSLYLKEEKRAMPATEWIMEVFMKPAQADQRKAFRVDHPEVISLLKLPEKNPQTGEDGKHYSFHQIQPGLTELENQTRRISQIEAARRNSFERAVMKLQAKLFQYIRLKNTLQPQTTTNFQADLQGFLAVAKPGMEAFSARQASQSYDTNTFESFSTFLSRFDAMTRFDPPLLVPPPNPEVSRDDWRRVGEAIIQVIHGQPLPNAVTAYAAMSDAFRQDKVEPFNQAVAAYRQSLTGDFSRELSKAKAEHWFNHLQVFYKTSVIYVLAFLLACVSWFNLSEWMRRSAFYLIALALVLHSAGLVFRMVLEGRPPVTNLYSSAVFIGWGAVVLGIILERIFRDGIGSVVASSVGFLTLVIAHNLSMGGDTMEMMRAVLDTNFWLATHVVVITLGYAATFVAGFLAIIYTTRGVFTKTLTPQTGRALSRMVYGIICFATLFSFVGTVLGGIWADQSWGRFWGWDPKENGALIIVLWNALILHARWGGLIRERGLMNMAVVGNIVTAWSWFGVNMLGIGLHSYGFMDAAFWWLMFFVGSQLLLVTLGLLPKTTWRSYQAAGTDPTAALPAPDAAGK